MYVYRLRSINNPNEIYIGRTENPTRRLAQHNHGQTIHTNKFRPWRFDLVIWLRENEKAHAFETYLKSHSGKEFAKRHF